MVKNSSKKVSAKKPVKRTSYQKKNAVKNSVRVGAAAGTSTASGLAGRSVAYASKATVKKSVSTAAKVESRRQIGKGVIKGLTGVEKTIKVSFIVGGIILGLFFLCGMIYLALAIKTGNPDAARQTVFGLSALPLQRFTMRL